MAERTLNINGKKYNINNLIIKIDDKLSLSPGEVDIATALISMAGQMSSMPRLPAEIQNEPFTIEFKEDGNHTLRKGYRGEEISFTFEEVDDIISGLQMAQSVAVDLQKLAPQTMPTFIGPGVPDVFDGRN